MLCLPAYQVVGDGACPVADTWFQTETGGHMIVDLPTGEWLILLLFCNIIWQAVVILFCMLEFVSWWCP